MQIIIEIDDNLSDFESKNAIYQLLGVDGVKAASKKDNPYVVEITPNCSLCEWLKLSIFDQCKAQGGKLAEKGYGSNECKKLYRMRLMK